MKRKLNFEEIRKVLKEMQNDLNLYSNIENFKEERKYASISTLKKELENIKYEIKHNKKEFSNEELMELEILIVAIEQLIIEKSKLLKK